MQTRPYILKVLSACEYGGTAGDFVGIDQHSGGYPWFPTNIESAHHFRTFEESRKYAATFKHPETIGTFRVDIKLTKVTE